MAASWRRSLISVQLRAQIEYLSTCLCNSLTFPIHVLPIFINVHHDHHHIPQIYGDRVRTTVVVKYVYDKRWYESN